MLAGNAGAREFHVAKSGSDNNPGTAEAPFLTINRAAMELRAGDTVTVHAGVYREWVKPRNSGADFYSRIVYRTRKPEASLLQWYAEVTDTETTLWANFGGADPNKELVEVNARQAVFFPELPGVNFITVKGFHMSQAAVNWAPPTAFQPGLVGPHWSKGWVIEDNVISSSQASYFRLAMHVGGNAYYNGTKHYAYEEDCVSSASDPKVRLERRGDEVVLTMTLDPDVNGVKTHPVNTDMLGKTFYSNGYYENPDGSPLAIDRDFSGNPRSLEHPSVGPFEQIRPGRNEFVVWKFR